MEYRRLVEVYEKLEATTKKLEKRDILSEFYKNCSEEDLSKVVLLSMGIVLTGELELGIAREMVKRIIIKSTGSSESELMKKFKETGDLGATAEYFIQHRKQYSLGKRTLTVEKVFNNLRQLPEITGSGSQERKISLVTELLSSASGKEARYIVRTVLGEMRIGVAAGIVRNAIALAFGKEQKEVEHAFDITGDYGLVAEMAKKDRLKTEIIIGRPVRVMLADRSPDLASAMKEFEQPCLETKYDGFRISIHKQFDKIKLFSRRLDDVTKQFPEIVRWSKECIACRACIIEGEVLALSKEGKPLPFQQLSRRIQRKYDIEKMVKEVPVQANLFELIYFNSESFMNKPLRERWNKLNLIINEKKGKFQLAEHIETKDIEKAKKFYEKSLELGQEGVIVKNLDAVYQPGRRVGYWLKVKPIMEPLDLVIIGATWGEGQRTKQLGSMLLAARSGKQFLPTGMMGSGLTEEQLEEVTKKLKKIIIEEHDNEVVVKPEIVIEVAYEEIQKSTKYPSG
ncbi:MAG: ATP-dependent DNA ligase [Candidatus Aenigmarchaeota archaeon]|nr:ATP-dependent DNA ligase [Candidatus Aenigmarchaeota archaeon]